MESYAMGVQLQVVLRDAPGAVGPVARGDSDIDLVAVFDDLDYSQRLSLRLSLGAAAAAGRPVEVYVTDRPEWARRTRDVSASFEARIAPGRWPWLTAPQER